MTFEKSRRPDLEDFRMKAFFQDVLPPEADCPCVASQSREEESTRRPEYRDKLYVGIHGPQAQEQECTVSRLAPKRDHRRHPDSPREELLQVCVVCCETSRGAIALPICVFSFSLESASHGHLSRKHVSKTVCGIAVRA